MNRIRCPICTNDLKPCFSTTILGKYSAQYAVCGFCGFLKVQEPTWLDEAYADAIVGSDTGIMMRNFSTAAKLCNILYFGLGFRGDEKYLDAAGGYGILTRLMRDFGFNFYWTDKFCKNLVAMGFEYTSEIGMCEGVTAIEVMEHLEDPKSFISDAIKSVGASTFIFTTELYSGLPPDPQAWRYYALQSGQHIGFFQAKTLAIIARDLGFYFYSAAGIHIFSKKKINKLVLFIVTTRPALLVLPWIIRILKGSKTIQDHDVMIRLAR